MKNITVDGLTRKYLVHAPSGAREPMPVVFILHGGGSGAWQMELYSNFNRVADREGFLAVYPSGVDGNWNDGRGVEGLRAQKEKIDDVKFLRMLVDELAKENKIDRGRVFATGISNGGFMSHRLAAEASDVFAGIAPVSGGLAPAIAEKFKPQYPVSILLIHGEADPIVPFAGGEVGFSGGRKRGKLIPTTEALAKYVARSGNQGEPTVGTLEPEKDDGTSAVVTKYPDGPGGVKTWYYLVKNGGHTWPGRPPYLPERIIGKASHAFSASETIGQFFMSCPARVLKHP